MARTPLDGRASGLRWRRHGTRALALVAVGITAAGITGSAIAPVGPAAAESRQPAGPLAYHATIVNGSITGSGFLIADGLAITNAHVVAGTPPGAEVRLIASTGAGRQAVGRVLAVSRRMDIALVRVPAGFLPVAPAADAPLRRGATLRAAGVIAHASGPGPRLELDGAVASAPLLLPPYGPGFIASMPGVHRGFSGGPVFDGDGRLAGMIAALRPDPAGATSAAGAPARPGSEAFVLGAPVIRAEAARLLAIGR